MGKSSSNMPAGDTLFFKEGKLTDDSVEKKCRLEDSIP